jgi:hypothetical protein
MKNNPIFGAMSPLGPRGPIGPSGPSRSVFSGVTGMSMSKPFILLQSDNINGVFLRLNKQDDFIIEAVFADVNFDSVIPVAKVLDDFISFNSKPTYMRLSDKYSPEHMLAQCILEITKSSIKFEFDHDVLNVIKQFLKDVFDVIKTHEIVSE